MRGKICIFVAALAALLALQGCMRRDAVIFQGISDVEVSMEASPRVGVVLLVAHVQRDGVVARVGTRNHGHRPFRQCLFGTDEAAEGLCEDLEIT